MIIMLYIVLYVIIHIILQRIIGKSSNRIALILARDSGAIGVVAFLAYLAGALDLHAQYSFLLQLSLYFAVLSIGAYLVIKHQRKSNKPVLE
jgi:hypothetical protein